MTRSLHFAGRSYQLSIFRGSLLVCLEIPRIPASILWTQSKTGTLWSQMRMENIFQCPFLFLFCFFTALQCCVFLLCQEVNQPHVCTYPPTALSPASRSPSHSPSCSSRSLQNTKPSFLCVTVGSHQLSVLHLGVYLCNPNLPIHPTLPFPPCGKITPSLAAFGFPDSENRNQKNLETCKHSSAVPSKQLIQQKTNEISCYKKSLQQSW